MNKNELFSMAVRIIMNDWDWRPDGYHNECKFCGCRNGVPSIERHWEHCPRLIWAIANDETPSKKVNKRFPGHQWDNDHEAMKYYRGPFLYNDGPELLGILAEAMPNVYGMHYEAYTEMYDVWKVTEEKKAAFVGARGV